jgi:hypothetical protein
MGENDMCQKCVRAAKKSKAKFGKINFLAHYVDAKQFASIPMFEKKVDNLAVEARLHLIRKAKTKKRYSRKSE